MALMVAPALLGSGRRRRRLGRGRGGVGAMLAVMAVALVYEKLGLTFVRRAWINSDQFCAGASSPREWRRC
jgi:hypothetical protein